MLVMMLFKKAKKMNILFIMSPLIFLISMLPINYIELTYIAKTLNNSMFILVITVTILLSIAYKMKGGNQC